MISGTSDLQLHGSILPDVGEERDDRYVWIISRMTDKKNGSTRRKSCPSNTLPHSGL
jgi:hypothetical protein